MLNLKDKFINSNNQNNPFYFERRSFIRLQTIDLDIPILIKSSNNEKSFMKGKIINTSNEGLLIQIKKSIAINKKISFKFKLPEPYNSIEGNGILKWGRENNNILYYGIKINKFKDEISSAKFYDFLIEKGIEKDLNLNINEKENETIELKANQLSDRIPKTKKKTAFDRRNNDRRKFQIILNSSDRRIKERRKKDRRYNEERRKSDSTVLNENRKHDRRKLKFFDYSKEFIEHRRKWLEQKLNVDLQNIGYYSMDTQNAKGNIENMIGTAQIPIGIAGPCKINGDYARGDFYIPLATTEGALVMTYQRGMMALNLAGGANVKILKDNLHISPVFLFSNLMESVEFQKWVDEHFFEIKKEAEKTTKHGKLLSIEPRITGNKVILTFHYSTGDAAGQNMIAISTDAACNYIREQTGHKFYLKSNFSSDKKISGYNYIKGYGKSVIAEISLPSEITKKIFDIYPEDMFDCYQANIISTKLAKMEGVNSHVSNCLAAIFIACGQDIASITNSCFAIIYSELTKENNLYLTVYFPSLVIGTVGGGVSLGTQKECLKILDCYGNGNSKKFAEIIGAAALAGEISIAAAITKGSFAQGHVKYGR